MTDVGLWPKGFRLKAHIPASADGTTPVVVVVHGISRNSNEHLAVFADLAGDHCAVIAPHFPRQSFPNYQTLGIDGNQRRADIVFDAALERLGHRTGTDIRRFHLFGFSGGAQFAHRYAMLNPGRIQSLHIASAGWYTFPETTIRWPRGLCGNGVGGEMAMNIPRFLRLPIRVYVGENDIARDGSLRTGSRIDTQQGFHRRSRAETWVRRVGELQGSIGPQITLDILPGVDHDFASACALDRGGLAAVVLDRILRRAMSGQVLRPSPAKQPVHEVRAPSLTDSWKPHELDGWQRLQG